MGLSIAAFWAGYHPKKMPVRVQTANERKTPQGWI